MEIDTMVASAQEHLETRGLDGWLIYDYRNMNPIFFEALGSISNITRPCWLWIPTYGEPALLVAFVDKGRFARLGIRTVLFAGRNEMIQRLTELLANTSQIAMEYSELGELPRISKVDAGTLELVRNLGIQVTSSADTLQYATQRWSLQQLQSHKVAAGKLGTIVKEAFEYLGKSPASRRTEIEIAQFIRKRFNEEGLDAPDGPIVAANEHSSDPHFDPMTSPPREIKNGDWLLIDLWARLSGKDTMFADITWTAFIGDQVPKHHQRIFDIVTGARDEALSKIKTASESGYGIQGYEVDEVAREYIERAGYGQYFGHRLGHSLGTEVHGNAVNLDSWETTDVRQLIPGIAVTIEPGIYLPEFGVRSEIDVFLSENGPVVTTEIQQSPVLVHTR